MKGQTMKRLSWKNFTASITHHMGNVHVGTSNAGVEAEIREAIAKFRRANRNYSVSKRTEDACVKFALHLHDENRAVYRWVYSSH